MRISIIFLLFATLGLKAHFVFDDHNKEAYNDLLCLKLEKAQKLTNHSLSISPNNGISLYLNAYIATIKLFLDDNQAQYESQLKTQDQLEDKFKHLKEESPYKMFLLAEHKLHWAMLKMKFGDELSGALDLREAYKMLESNIAKYPNFKPNYKSMGVLHILVGTVPSNYRWIVNIVGMTGSIPQGCKELKMCIDDHNEFSLEAELYRLLIDAYILKRQKESIQELKNLYRKHYDNLTLALVLASSMLHNQLSSEAYMILQSRPASEDYYKTNVATKMLGDCYFFDLKYAEAIICYQSFLKTYKGENYKKDINFKFFLMEWFQKGTQNQVILNKVLNEGNTVFEVDKHALRFATDIKLQNIQLTKARVLFDGGFFERSEHVLESIKPTDLPTNLLKQEYCYRKGRVYSSVGKTNQAIEAYKKAVSYHNVATNAYYAPNACLQLGYLYLDRYDYVNAKIYFKKSINDYSGHEYESSIESKARLALKELR